MLELRYEEVARLFTYDREAYCIGKKERAVQLDINTLQVLLKELKGMVGIRTLGSWERYTLHTAL